jgi:signal transduction histidine kinase
MSLTVVNNPAHINAVWELRSLAGIILNSFRPAASQQDCVLSNDIPEDIYLLADKEALAKVLRVLLSTVIRHSNGSYIRLTAKIYSDVILLHILDHSLVNSIRIDKSLQVMVGKLGGYIDVTSKREAVTTVAFCFPNLPHVA